VPGKPAMFGTTKDFLDYFGLKKLEDLPTLAEIKDGLPELSPQTDLIDSLEARAEGGEAAEADAAPTPAGEPADIDLAPANDATAAHTEEPTEIAFDDEDSDEDDGSELDGPDLIDHETEAREA
jgi:segregation and condensation protein B